MNLLLSLGNENSSSYLELVAKETKSETDTLFIARTTAIHYALETFKTLGLPRRTYIFKGGVGVDVNGNGEIVDIADNPETTENEAVIETTAPWCFAYGEEEWVSGVSFSDALAETRRIRLGAAEEGDFNYEVNCQ